MLITGGLSERETDSLIHKTNTDFSQDLNTAKEFKHQVNTRKEIDCVTC